MKNKKNLIIILSCIFILLGLLVKLDKLDCFDTFFYNLITFNINDNFTIIYKIITFLGSTAFIIAACVILFGIFAILKKLNYSLIISSVVIISTVINNLVKLLIRRERPNVLSFVTEHSYSFPSGHTMAATTLYGILLYLLLKSNCDKKLKIILGIILGLLPLLVALSRVYLGAHFMSDVVGGIILSTLLLIIEIHFIDKNKWI